MKPLLLLVAALAVQDPAVLSGHTREVSSLAIAKGGKLLASGSVDRTVRLWDTATRENVATLEGHGGEVMALAFSPDGKLLASGEMYKKVFVWDASARKEIQRFEDIDGAVLGLVFSADGKRLFAACRDNSALVWSVGSPAPAKKLAHNYAVNGIALSPDGKVLATIDDGGSVHLWNSETLNKGKSLKHADTGRCVAFSPDGKTLASGGGGKVKLWDTASGAEKTATDAEANALAWTPNGSTLVVGTQDNLTLFLSSTDLSIRRKVEAHERPVTAVAVSSDGNAAYTGSMDWNILVWALK